MFANELNVCRWNVRVRTGMPALPDWALRAPCERNAAPVLRRRIHPQVPQVLWEQGLQGIIGLSVLETQCYGALTFWYVSRCGSLDPYLLLTDPDAEHWYIYIIHLTNGSGSGSCSFQWPSRSQQKISVLLITFWRYIYNILKDKKS